MAPASHGGTTITTSTYNGFDGRTRDRVQLVLNAKFASGEWPRPAVCVGCGETNGVLDAHLEDYSKPETYVALCFRCHMMVHCRRGRDGGSQWRAYLDALHRGVIFPTVPGRNWNEFKRTTLSQRSWPGYPTGEPRGPIWLDRLDGDGRTYLPGGMVQRSGPEQQALL